MRKRVRDCGVLLHISSLPGDFGIGNLGKEAYEFVDFLHAAGQKYWQVLPLGPTQYGDSPYQSPSAFAGNPYFIDPRNLYERGLLTKEELELARTDNGAIDYGRLFSTREKLLYKAFGRFEPNADYAEFCRKNGYWLTDYALFCALKKHNGYKPHWEWGKTDTAEFASTHSRELDYVRFEQYLFDTQWRELKSYANARGMEIIGDAPIYLSYDGADFFANRQMFQTDEDGKPTAVAGVPPDYFSADGQLWGNPLYDWDYMAEHGYGFWIKRVSRAYELFDWLRIDHFRGFAEYYSIDAGATTAKEGTWRVGPGKALFDAAHSALGKARIIAEDLGVYSEALGELMKACGYPGMKVVQFGFGGAARDNTNAVSNFTYNSIGYTATHDNDTSEGWFASLDAHMRKRVLSRLPRGCKSVSESMIRALYGSKSKTAIVPMQDWLGEGSEARMNTPGTDTGNWQYRLKTMPDGKLADKMHELAERYCRINN